MSAKDNALETAVLYLRCRCVPFGRFAMRRQRSEFTLSETEVKLRLTDVQSRALGLVGVGVALFFFHVFKEQFTIVWSDKANCQGVACTRVR